MRKIYLLKNFFNMWFLFKRKKILTPYDDLKEDYLNIFEDIIFLLRKNEVKQALDHIYILRNFLKNGDYESFKRELNTVEMWGELDLFGI